jgi:hypothetical protein
MVDARWPDGVARCPTCDPNDMRFISTLRMWECKHNHPRRQFSAKVGLSSRIRPSALTSG